MDIASLVISLPTVIDAVVKTCNAAKKYNGIQEQHIQVIQRAIFNTKKLAYYSGFINVDDLHHSNYDDPRTDDDGEAGAEHQQLLEEALLHAIDAVQVVQTIVEEWALRLGIERSSGGRVIMAKIATFLAEKLMRTRDGHSKVSKRYGASRASRFRSRLVYLATGCRRINDNMDILERWIDQLRDILLTLPHLTPIRDLREDKKFQSDSETADDVLFVAGARQRLGDQFHVPRVDSKDVCTISDLDPAHPTGLFMVEDGPYMGCLIDRRRVDYLFRYNKGDQAIKDTELIATLFAEDNNGSASGVSPSVGILRCRGWSYRVVEEGSHVHDLLFRLPPGSRAPRTLRMLLLEGTPRHSLNDRLRFSIQLATSVLIIHSLGLVHKDIRPDSILVVEPLGWDTGREDQLRALPRKLGAPFLASFNRSRSDDADTVVNPFGTSPYMQIMYIHPRHTTTVDHLRYQMRDDIYSLGVCLLEVALWRSFFKWSNGRKCYDADFSWFDFSHEKYKEKFRQMGQPEYRDRAWLLQDDLVDLAEREIPVVMGDTFKDVVVSCLLFGSNRRQPLHELVMKRSEAIPEPKGQSIVFVQKVLMKLHALKFI